MGIEEEIEPSIESSVSKLNLAKKVQPKMEPKKTSTETGETPVDPSELRETIGETKSEANPNKQNEDKTDVKQPGEEARNESETRREEEENSGTTATKRKV